ncbi:MAG: sigma-54-dependent transcriptional response [Geobacteraceae bacterium]|nr:MAG: sigma-54-dependent transcriptional response [Geobacteraceae bacterium]
MNHASNSHLPVLLVDDEPEILVLTKMTLGSEGIYNVLTIDDSRKVIPLLEKEKVSAIILDLMMPYLSGTELLASIAGNFPDIPVIVMTAADEVETAVECLKTGAFDYLLKPVDPNRLVSAVQKAIKLNSLENEVSSLKEYLLTGRLEHAEAFAEIITCSRKMRAIFQYAEVISKSLHPILITGETGVGKDLMANAIYKLSGVKGPFITVNVAGLDDVVFSDTLFGHKRGAFTGANSPREGLISKAAGGTLFLDEIGDLNPLSQVKLLRLLQGQDYYPLGSDVLKSSDARIIVATNHDLPRLIAAGEFRKDLYYRLCAYQIHIPPLSERPEDLPLLLHHFIEKAATSLNKAKPVPSPRLLTHLEASLFPGNVRELQAMVYDAVARHRTGMLSLESFPGMRKTAAARAVTAVSAAAKDADELWKLFGRFPTIEEMEEYMVTTAMKLADGKQGFAASLLGITRQGLYKRIKHSKISNSPKINGK